MPLTISILLINQEMFFKYYRLIQTISTGHDCYKLCRKSATSIPIFQNLNIPNDSEELQSDLKKIVTQVYNR